MKARRKKLRVSVLRHMKKCGNGYWLLPRCLIQSNWKEHNGGGNGRKVSVNENRRKAERPGELQICEEPYEKGAI